MRRLRLGPDTYAEGHCFSLVLSTFERKPVFSDPALVELCLDGLQEAAVRYQASVYACCFMPNHLHLLVSIPEGISLVTFVRHFKQLTAYRFRQLSVHSGKALWQRRFYDHALRREEDLRAVANYIWGNPIRAALASDLRGYHHWGSFVWDMQLSGSEDPDLQHLSSVGTPGHVGQPLQILEPET